MNYPFLAFPPFVLELVRGVYLLVADDGAQYVGSASGQDGFIGRRVGYATSGHGGNVILRKRGIVTILYRSWKSHRRIWPTMKFLHGRRSGKTSWASEHTA